MSYHSTKVDLNAINKRNFAAFYQKIINNGYKIETEEDVVKRLLLLHKFDSPISRRLFRFRLESMVYSGKDKEEIEKEVVTPSYKDKIKVDTQKLINSEDLIFEYFDPDKLIKFLSDEKMFVDRYLVLPIGLLLTNVQDYRNFHKMERGMQRMAITIGPYIFEWNDIGLAVPRKIEEHHERAIYPVTKSINRSQLEIIIKTICEWNNSYEYESCLLVNRISHKGNSSHFINDILNSIKMKIPCKPWGVFDKYYSKVEEGTLGKDIMISDLEDQEIFINNYEELRAFSQNITKSDKYKRDSATAYEYNFMIRAVERIFLILDKINNPKQPQITNTLFGSIMLK